MRFMKLHLGNETSTTLVFLTLGSQIADRLRLFCKPCLHITVIIMISYLLLGHCQELSPNPLMGRHGIRQSLYKSGTGTSTAFCARMMRRLHRVILLLLCCLVKVISNPHHERKELTVLVSHYTRRGFFHAIRKSMATCFFMWHLFISLFSMEVVCKSQFWNQISSDSDGSAAFHEMRPTGDTLGRITWCRKMWCVKRFLILAHKLPNKCIYLKYAEMLRFTVTLQYVE